MGISEEEDRLIVVVILAKDSDETRSQIAQLLTGVEYKIEVTGEFKPLKVSNP